MNKGFAHCDGDVLGFLNSDDWFTTASAVETIVNAFSKDYDAVYGDIHIVGKDSPEKQIYYQSGRMFRPFLLRFGFAPAHPTFYVRRSLLQSYGAYNDNYKIAGDFDLIARFCHKYKIKTKYLHTDLVTMAIGGVSTKDEEAYAEGLNEILYSCKSLGIRTSKTMLSLKKYFLMLANII